MEVLKNSISAAMHRRSICRIEACKVHVIAMFCIQLYRNISDMPAIWPRGGKKSKK
jgi:hypothetical protein